MIVVQQRPDEETRTPGKSCHWVASTIVDGVTYRARSRRGAPNELARVLVENASEPVHRARYRSPEDQFGHLRNRDLAGGKPPGAALKSPEFETA
jgi:hypothetical protein